MKCKIYIKKLYTVIVIALVGIITFIYLLRVPLKSKRYENDNIIAKKIRSLGLNQWKVNASLIKLGREDTLYHQNELRTIEVLTKTFERVDSNDDKRLDEDELASWIDKQVKDHFSTALKENIYIFTAIDVNPGNGEISWKEYYRYVLKRRGYNDTFITHQKESLKGMPRDLKESLMKDKAYWSEAARTDPARLTLDEFLHFRHPESSHASISSIVDQMLSKLDTNGDNMLSEDEFIDPETNDVPDHLNNIQFVAMRKQLFRDIVDKNHSLFAERKELLRFIDPRSPHHARQEAEDLVSIADTNLDSLLSLDEILAQKDIFIVSKMVDVAKSFHDEF